MKLLKYPYPFKAWLSISNDPDNTTLKNWHQLHDYIWLELRLPLGDALFLESYNQNLPNQVSLSNKNDILKQHFHDSLHFWGDYQHSRTKLFDRNDAELAIKKLQNFNFTPRVWVDHSFNQANFTHGNCFGANPKFYDASGIEYQNFQYSLDLAIKSGISYVWHGDITQIIGQDIKISYWKLLKSKHISFFKKILYSLLKMINIFLPSMPKITQNNNQFWKYSFPDGNNLYCFQRYGTWKDADIDGLGDIIAPENINKLIFNEGSCIVYTHLGKRKKHRMNDTNHIPEHTKKALGYIKELYRQQRINISPISIMLDYMVIRDNITIDNVLKIVDFNHDGIRFKKLTIGNLVAHQFSFNSKENLKEWTFKVDGMEIKPRIYTQAYIHTISFYE